MQKYLEDFKKHKDYINKVKRFQNLTPLQKMKIRQAQAEKMGESIHLDAAELKKQVFERLKDTEEDQIKEMRKDKTLEKLHMVKPIMQNIRMDEIQARDIVQPNRRMCSSSIRANFLEEVCYRNEESIGETLSTFER